MPDLLLEIFSEEIPARMQTRAAEDLKKGVTDRLVEAGLTYESAGAFATPRRLTLTLTGLPRVTPDTREERKGPKADAPEKAVEGFLRSTGLTRDQLETREDKKGPTLYASIARKGRPTAEVIAEAVPETIRNFPWPKSMRWGTGSLRWVRPLQSILCLLSDDDGAKVVPFSVDGIDAGATTRGHRFMAGDAFKVSGFDDYRTKLSAAKVMLDPAERMAKIEHDAQNLAFAQGLELVEDKGLLAEVAGLVEWPVVLMGEIGAEFLDLPPEVLQTSMKEHQKFFSLRNPKTSQIERFITVANIETADLGATILAGNQKVLSARLSDAKFFWENDLRKVKAAPPEGGMAALAKPLEAVTFHAKLGTQSERIDRIAALAREIAPKVGADPDLAEQAARIAKADLSSEMVYEFPELQGIMGGYYAHAAGLPEEVAAACEAHYRPLGPSDTVPTEPVSIAVALADKLDILTGFWAIDEKPTGSKDPFALRRAALGTTRLLLSSEARMTLMSTFQKADSLHSEKLNGGLGPSFTDYGPDLLTFFADRLKVFLRDQGIRHDVIDACFSLGGQDDLVLLVKRVRALQSFLDTEDGINLLAGYKRASNILSKEAWKDETLPDPALTQKPEETALFAALDAADPQITSALKHEDFDAAMSQMATLRAPIDAFFTEVTVNAEDPHLRVNRLRLLARIRATMRQVAIWETIQS